MEAIETKVETQNQRSKGDSWSAWPAVAALVIAFITAVVCSLPGLVSFILIPLTVLGAPLIGVALVIAAAVIAMRRRPRLAVSILIAVLFPPLLWKPITRGADLVHLGLTIWTDAGQVRYSSRPEGNPFFVYDWSVGFAGGTNTFLIYDVTDEIGLPPELHRHPIESQHGFGEGCADKVEHLLGHYYICRD